MITKEFFSVDRLMSEGKYGDFCIYYRSHQNRVSFISEFYKTRRLSELYKQVCFFKRKSYLRKPLPHNDLGERGPLIVCQ